MNGTSEVGLYYYGCWYKLTYDVDNGQPLRLEIMDNNIDVTDRRYDTVWGFAKMWHGGFGGLTFTDFVMSIDET